MAINLASKYSDKVAEKFKASSFVAGNTSSEYEFSGVQSIKIFTIQTEPLVDYTRSGSNRYGASKDVQDTIQEMKMTQDKAFSLVIDKGNNSDQMMIKNAGKVMKLQIDEQVVPMVDKYYFKVLSILGGKIANIAAPSKTTICGLIDDGIQELDENLVPNEGRVLYVTPVVYKLIRQSNEFVNLEELGTKAISKGHIGEYGGMNVIKVPSSYFPSGVQFCIVYKSATLLPYKIKDTKIHQDPPGISGALLEGRNYYDAFIIGTKACGIYIATTVTKQATPTAVGGSGIITFTSAGASKILVTTDGTDPRYSATVTQVATGGTVTLTAGTYKVRAVAFHATNATSDVFSGDITVS